MSRDRELPEDCPLRDKLYKLKELILNLNGELHERFGPAAVLDVQVINPESMAYEGAGLRWLVILPWPNIAGEAHKQLMALVVERIQSFDSEVRAKSFSFTTASAGGATAIMVGLREKPTNPKEGQ